ncbi:MAG: D-aminoacyl-tRNA deacylase [Clostridia bacterium]|nr:D-aminoacyl-tRNA deacylase [Clostridia bacterium]
MRVVIQRVHKSSLSVDDKVVSQIGAGLQVFVGVVKTDTEANAIKMANKIVNMRIFREGEKLNKSVKDIGGEILLVSNFTLCSRDGSGTRPDFSFSADKDTALKLYLKLAEEMQAQGVPTKLGRFGEHMEIDCVLDGPINIYKEI